MTSLIILPYILKTFFLQRIFLTMKNIRAQKTMNYNNIRSFFEFQKKTTWNGKSNKKHSLISETLTTNEYISATWAIVFMFTFLAIKRNWKKLIIPSRLFWFVSCSWFYCLLNLWCMPFLSTFFVRIKRIIWALGGITVIKNIA